MFSSSRLAVAGVVAVVAGMVSASPNPTEPSSTSVFNIGKSCTIKWDPDTTGTWKQMNIQLMTGDNWNMIPITTIAQNIDATDATKNTYTYDCPEVTPTSPIYFYQFSSPTNATDLLWTTRFTIAGPNGEIVPATETTQPDGQKIPWGKGALVDPSTAVPPPAYLGTTQSGGATGTASAGTSASATGGSSSAAVATVSPPASASTPAASPSAPASMTTSVRSTARTSATGSATASAAAASGSANAALGGAAPGVMAVVGALFAAVGMF
ncbi:hypothetical protein FRC08_012581 [Ceratobasidium sp. 394]|nr:hypothetical protein FRC08_012581 [Ceratobasidium sp. 394]